MKEGWQLPVASDPPPAPDANDFPLPQGYFWGPLNGPDQCISGQYPGELPAWLDGLGRWQATLGLPVTKKWDDGTTPQAATTLQQAQHWPATPGVGFGTIHQGEWDAVMRGAWRLPDDWDPSKVSPGGLASSAAAIPVNEVTFERGAFVRGKDAYLGYLASALDVMGITDDFAKNNWTQGVLTAAGRESSYNPDAGNDWDVNANGPRLCDGFRANCSRGVLQTIPSTFASFQPAGYQHQHLRSRREHRCSDELRHEALRECYGTARTWPGRSASSTRTAGPADIDAGCRSWPGVLPNQRRQERFSALCSV